MSCATNKKNLGRSRCSQLPSLPSGMITTPEDFVIPKATLKDEALLKTFLNAAILNPLASRVYYWPSFASFENISQEQVWEDTPLAYLPILDGNYRFRFGISESMCLHRNMYTHRAINNGRIILIDKENQLILSENANGDGIGFGIQVLHTEKFQFNDGSVATKSPIVVALRNNKELDKNGIIVPFDAVGELYRLVDVTLEVIDSSDTELVVDVYAACDGTKLNGLVLADFVALDEDGNPLTISDVEEDDGRYTLTGTFTDGTISLKAPSTLSVKAYEAEVIDFVLPT